MTTARPTIEMSKSSHISQPPCCMRPINPENTVFYDPPLDDVLRGDLPPREGEPLAYPALKSW